MSQLLLFGQITRLDSMERRSTLPHEPAKYIFEPSLPSAISAQLLMIGFMTMAFDTNLSVGWRARCDKTFLCIGYLVGNLIQKVLENRYLRVCYPTGLFQRLCSIIRYLISNWSDDRSQLDITAVIWQQQQLQTSKMETLVAKKEVFIHKLSEEARRRHTGEKSDTIFGEDPCLRQEVIRCFSQIRLSSWKFSALPNSTAC